MRHPQFILVKIGTLADGKGTGAYQIYEKMPGDVPVYEVHNVMQNDPVNLKTATRRLAMLESGAAHA
jgi:hypothetical protein